MSTRAAAGVGPYMTSPEFLAECELLGGPPQWVGPGAESLGLRGEATPDQIRAVAAGFHPHTGEPLVRNAGSPTKHTGVHVVLAPDKSVSVLFGTASPEARAEIVGVHRAAVRHTLAAADALMTARVGAGGRQEVSARLVAFEATHPNSRAHNPHLHSHAGVLGVTVCDADGRTRALQSRQVFEVQRLMEAVYQLELANGLARLGYAVEARNGVAVVPDVPRELCRALSSRSERIAEYVRAFGKDSPAIRKLAATLTRPAKVAEDLPAMTARWQAKGREHGFSAEAIRATPVPEAKPRPAFARHAAAVKLTLESADRLASTRGQFTALRWQAEATRRAVGRGLSADDVRQAVEKVAEKPTLYGVSAVARPTREPLYTTPAARPFWDRLATEVLKAATPAPDTPAAKVASAAVAKLHQLGEVGRTLAEKASLTRVVVAVGAAAAGVAEAVKAIWSEYRHPVTRVRADKAGRDPASLTRLLADLRPASRRRAHVEAFRALARQPLGRIADLDSAVRFLERAFREARRPKIELHARSVVVVERCGDATPEQLRELTRRVAQAKARLALVERTDTPKAAVVELARRVNRRDTPKPRPVPQPVQQVAR